MKDSSKEAAITTVQKYFSGEYDNDKAVLSVIKEDGGLESTVANMAYGKSDEYPGFVDFLRDAGFSDDIVSFYEKSSNNELTADELSAIEAVGGIDEYIKQQHQQQLEQGAEVDEQDVNDNVNLDDVELETSEDLSAEKDGPEEEREEEVKQQVAVEEDKEIEQKVEISGDDIEKPTPTLAEFDDIKPEQLQGFMKKSSNSALDKLKNDKAFDKFKTDGKLDPEKINKITVSNFDKNGNKIGSVVLTGDALADYIDAVNNKDKDAALKIVAENVALTDLGKENFDKYSGKGASTRVSKPTPELSEQAKKVEQQLTEEQKETVKNAGEILENGGALTKEELDNSIIIGKNRMAAKQNATGRE